MASKAPDEAIVTLFEKDLGNIDKSNKLKYKAFLPRKNDPFNLSVYSIKDLLEKNQQNEIWGIGDNCVYKKIGKRAIGRADLHVNEIRNVESSALLDDVYLDSPINSFINNYCERHAGIKLIASCTQPDKLALAIDLCAIQKPSLR